MVTHNARARGIITIISAALIAAASILLFWAQGGSGPRYFAFEAEFVTPLILTFEILLALYFTYIGVKRGKPLIAILAIFQAGLMLFFEMRFGQELRVFYNLFLDYFSIVMALIISFIGGLIAIYSVGYMKDFHQDYHGELRDKQNIFFFIIFAFLSAMFGIVFSNNLIWLYFFWEITTLCSFLLIGYKENEEAVSNSLRALAMNLLGGLAFAIGIYLVYQLTGSIEMDKLLLAGSFLAIIPATLFAIAGITKAAQMPFSSWLLGAMVAPTPVSALLHSSTMVKAGVYLILRMSPLLQGTLAGNLVALIGAFTFVMASFIAISQRDAKKVLAYSTIANLGLIVACAGVGTYEAVWAAILLIIFHALAKGLLFLCVGIVEHKLHSRDIEDMEGLIVSMPKTAWMMLVGMAGMFLAPFGMLISKWAVLKAMIDAQAGFVILVVFGSAASLFFWTKWMGKILEVTRPHAEVEDGIHHSEWFVLHFLAVLTIGICLLFPAVSFFLIEPYVISVYGDVTRMSRGNIIIMAIMLGMVILFPFSMPGSDDKHKRKIVGPYLSGANTADQIHFTNSLGNEQAVVIRNYYLEKYFGEKVLTMPSLILSTIIILLLVAAPLGIKL